MRLLSLNIKCFAVQLTDGFLIGKFCFQYVRLGTSCCLKPDLHLIDIGLAAFHVSLDSASRRVLHPTDQVEFSRLFLGVLTEVDALNSAEDLEVARAQGFAR